MAKKKAAPKKAKKAASTSARSNIQELIAKRALDPGAASRLDPGVVKTINKYTKANMKFLIKHQLKVCGIAQPKPDGSFF